MLSKKPLLRNPQPAAHPLDFEIHGHRRTDEYAWLQNPADPLVQEHLRAENAYADGLMRPTQKLQRALYKEIRSRIKEDDMSVPVKDGPYTYYVRMKKGKQYAIHCRREGEKGREQIILDENELAKGHSFFSLGSAEVSSDHRLLSYTIDTKGDENHTLYVKNLETGELIGEPIHSVDAVVWTADSRHLVYTLEEHPYPPRKAFLHKLRTPQSADVLLYEEHDPQWYVAVGKSRSREYIFIHAANYKTSEVRVVPANDPEREPQLFAPRAKNIRYGVEHHGEFFYITSNEKAVNFKISRTLVSKPEKAHWKTWLAHDEKRSILSLTPFMSFLALSVRENGSEEIYITSPEKKMSRIKLPEREHSVVFSDEIEYTAPFVRIMYSSLISPRTVFDYHVETKKFTVRKKQEVPKYSKSRYVSKREWVTNGSVKIPVVIVHKKGVKRNGKAPLLLEAYGSYGICNDPAFSVAKLSLLDRGFVLALAHPRGGGEMGWKWHKDAHLLTKHRTTDDFIAVADYLVEKKYTSHSKLGISGGSAGGMLMGQVMNKRPDVAGAALVYVPAADLITSLMDESLAGTRLHYDEIGDPRIAKHYEYLMRQSPYEQVHPAVYPTTLVRASAHDIRTPYWESAKWVARLRAKNTGTNLILFKCELAGGHFGKSGRYEWIKEKAFDYAFLISVLAEK